MEEITLESFDLKPSSDFGGGIEFLMNDKQGQIKKDPSISLEEELKEFDFLGKDTKPISMSFEKEPISIGRDTASMDTFKQSSDGYRHINEINVESEIKNVEVKTKEELLKEKFQMLRKLETLETKGISLSKQYTMESSLDEMKGEYEHHYSERERKNSVQFQGKILNTLITGIEFLNNKFDPFDIKLDGLAEQINENIDEYDEIFSELAEKYKSKAKMAPELKLLFQVTSSAIMVHMTNTMFKSSVPGMDDIMRQNPDLMKQFTTAAVKSMEKTTPGVSNFMNEFTSHPKPPPPQATQVRRPEMNGPENINSILTGLKKNININEKNDSIVSADEIEQLSSSGISTRKGRRRNDKNLSANSISIAI